MGHSMPHRGIVGYSKAAYPRIGRIFDAVPACNGVLRGLMKASNVVSEGGAGILARVETGS